MEKPRRDFLALLLGALLIACPASGTIAKDGHSGGGDDGGRGSDSSGDGRDGRGGDDDNSGRGKAGDDDDGDDDDQTRARDASRSGKVRKLRDILSAVRGEYDGEVLDVSLRRSGSAYVYRVKMIDARGRMFTVRVDAVNRRILGVGEN